MRMVRTVTGAAICLAVLRPFAPLVLWTFADAWFFPNLWPARLSIDAWRYVASPS